MQEPRRQLKNSHLAGDLVEGVCWEIGGWGSGEVLGAEESCWAIKMTDSGEKCFAASRVHAKAAELVERSQLPLAFR